MPACQPGAPRARPDARSPSRQARRRKPRHARRTPVRLREARIYIGYSRDAAAAHLHCELSLTGRMEDGAAVDDQLKSLAALYRRPAAWFRGQASFAPPCCVPSSAGRPATRQKR